MDIIRLSTLRPIPPSGNKANQLCGTVDQQTVAFDRDIVSASIYARRPTTGGVDRRAQAIHLEENASHTAYTFIMTASRYLRGLCPLARFCG